MSKEIMTIREMCEAFDVTPRALRFYESKELLSPEREGQRRLYNRRDRARLKLVLRGKRFGFSLEDIRQILELYDPTDAESRQLSRAVELSQRRLGELRAERDAIDAAITELTEHVACGQQMLATTGQSAA